MSMHRMTADVEARLNEIGLQLIDAARAEVGRMDQIHRASPSQITATTMSLAIQVAFMCEASADAQGEQAVVAFDVERIAAMFYGLGMGVGCCIGSCGADPMQLGPAMEAFNAGYESQLGERINLVGDAKARYRAQERKRGRR